MSVDDMTLLDKSLFGKCIRVIETKITRWIELVSRMETKSFGLKT